MPRVPVLTRQVGLNALPGPTVSSNATPALLGGITAKQLQSTGDDMLRGGVIMQRMQADEQEKVNTVRVQDALNKARAAQLHYTHDKVDGFTARRGEDALKGEDGKPLEDVYDGKLNTRFSEIKAELGNDNQRQEFQQYADRMRTEFGGSIRQHVGREFQVHSAEVRESTRDLSRQEIGANWGTPEVVGRANETIRKSVEEERKALGWGKVKFDEELVKQMSTGHMIVINSAVDASNLDYAREYMKQADKELTPEARLNALKVLNVGDFEVRTQTIANKYLDQAKGDHQLAAKLIRQNTSGKEQDGAVARINALSAEVDRYRERDQRQAADQAWKIKAGGGKVPPSLIARMDGRDVHSLQQTLKAESEGGVKTDMAVFAKISELPLVDPEGFKGLNLMQYSHQLSPSDLKSLLEKQHKFRAGKDDDLEVVQFQSQVTTMTQMLGLKGQEAGVFNKKADDALYAEQKTRGRKLTQEERQRVLDRMVLEVKYGKDGDWFRGSDPYYKAEGNATGKEFQIQFPEEERQKAKAAWMRKGILFPSDEDIDAAVRRKYLLEKDKR